MRDDHVGAEDEQEKLVLERASLEAIEQRSKLAMLSFQFLPGRYSLRNSEVEPSTYFRPIPSFEEIESVSNVTLDLPTVAMALSEYDPVEQFLEKIDFKHPFVEKEVAL